MSEEDKGAPAPSGTAAPEPSKPAEPAQIVMTSEALKTRLTEERTAHEKTVRAAMLKDLGVDKFDDAKSAIGEAAKLRQASLSELEKRDLRIKELEPFQQSAERVGSRFKALVDDQFGKLPDAAQKAIDDHAGGDAEKRFDMIELMRKSGALEALGKASEPVRPSAPTSITPTTPPVPGGQQSKFDEYQAMNARSPVMGDIFYQNNQREIERTRPSA